MASNNYYGAGGVSGGGFGQQSVGALTPNYGVGEGYNSAASFQGVHSSAMRGARGGGYQSESQPVSTFAHLAPASRSQALMAGPGFDDKAYYMSLSGVSTTDSLYDSLANSSYANSNTGGVPFYTDSRISFSGTVKGGVAGRGYGGFSQPVASLQQGLGSDRGAGEWRQQQISAGGDGRVFVSAPMSTPHSNYAADVMISDPYLARSTTGGIDVSCAVTGQSRAYGGVAGVGPAAVMSNDWQRRQQQQQQRYRPRQQPAKPTQLHYCDVCRVSCAGTQTYTEHLEGKNHKKKEMLKNAQQAASNKPGGVGNNNTSSGARVYHCELCDVSCTGNDTYAAHIHGVKHQKVLSLYTKLGKPIPEIIPPPVSTLAVLELNGQKSNAANTKTNPDDTAGDGAASGSGEADDDTMPIGLEYIEESKNEAGTTQGYYCKLCNCNFSDPLAKIMHSKGRRHRLQYKNKVDPTISVDGKSSNARKQYRGGGGMGGGDPRHYRRNAEDLYRRQVEELRYEKELLQWQLYNASDRFDMPNIQRALAATNAPDARARGQIDAGLSYGGGAHVMDLATQRSLKAAESADDRHVLAKHASIYPTEEDLAAVQTTVSSCEKALKMISDKLTEVNTDVKKEKKENDKQINGGENGKTDETTSSDKESSQTKLLKGVMRIGLLAKGLLLHNDLNMELVVLCTNRPTNALLRRILDALPDQLGEISSDKYLVRLAPNGNSITVMRDVEPRTTCVIVLTSHAVKEQVSELEEKKEDLLDTRACLSYLGRLKHTKWFQSKASALPSCVIVTRVLRDFSDRVPSWKHIPQWALELLVERCLSTGKTSHPGEAVRRVFECVASGIFLPDGSGLSDPCEKSLCDAAACLTSQQREDITNCAQHALRMISFGQIHRVLDMEKLPIQSHHTRKTSPVSDESPVESPTNDTNK